MMQDNGSVSKNVKYRNLCKEQITVHVAYIHQSEWFEIENNSMVDVYKKKQLLHGAWSLGGYPYISRDSEILSIFFKHYDVITKWINCNYTFGVFDDETEKWTGAVGQVSMVDQIS